MKKTLLIVILGLFTLMAFSIDAYAAKKTTKKSKVPQEQIQSMSDTIDYLTRKVYGNTLLSPEDNKNLINVKIKLDNQMLVEPDVVLAPLYYKLGCLLKLREMQSESIECFQTILENFSDTALAPKARANLRAMGVEVAEVEDTTSDDEEDY